MNLEINFIIIGNEILNGNTAEANLATLAKHMLPQGIKVKQTRIIGDQLEEIIKALEDFNQGPEIVIVCGGLGPTQDDVTKMALAQFLKVPLEENNEAQAIASDNYQRFGRSWNPSTNSYHILPRGVKALKNPDGLAPGLVYQKGKKLFFFGPGVPREFSLMVQKEFIPFIQQQIGQQDQQGLELFKIRTQGIPEEKIFFELAPKLWSKLEEFGSVSSLPQIIGVDIVVNFKRQLWDFSTLKEKFLAMPEAKILAPSIWQIGGLNLEEFVLQKFKDQKLTLALAESCTGGLLASQFTDIPGCSEVFQGSAVTYSNLAKEKILKVSPQTLNEHGAVSLQVAKEMAQGALAQFQSDVAIALSGIAGPGGGTQDKPVGTVAIALAFKGQETQAKFHHLKGDRLRLKKRFAARALFDLLENFNRPIG